MTDNKAPILIAGPTASGKSALALALAAHTKACIINADALQVYDCWRVLSARPSAQEEAQAPHRLYGHIHPLAEYSAGHWLRDVESCLSDARNTGQRPIIIGGTGLYFAALTQGLAEIPDIPDDLRQQGNDLINRGLVENMRIELRDKDPKTYAQIDTQNPVRVQRAWEVWTATGIGLKEWHARTPQPLVPVDKATCLVIEADRDWLADRIDRRFDRMLRDGALEEVQNVVAQGWDMGLPSMRAIGARELAAHLQGGLTLELAIEQGKAQSRQYAKRQRTWFRSKMKDWQKIPAQTDADIGKIFGVIAGPP